MAFREVEERQDGATKHLTLAREHLSVCSVHDPLGDPHPDPDTPAPAPAKPPTSGKLRRTALRFFGVRKSICLLPAIFGGRSKNQTKKRVGKSRTHDGLSKASCGASPGSEGASGGSFGTLGRRDGAQGAASSDYYLAAGEQKSQSFPRQKKGGLRGLFHSIRLHRAQRHAEAESNEMTTLPSSVALGEVPAAAAAVVVVVVVREDANRNECLGSLSSPEMPAGATLSAAAAAAAVPPECNDRDTRAFAEQGARDSLSFRDPVPDDRADENTSSSMTTTSGEYLDGGAAVVIAHGGSCPPPGLTPEAEPPPPPPAGSSDRLDLIFEDVASLKSFDSLTGCGDIIADQDDDSLAESTVSGERSRGNAGKRASCCLTYQGGGEEMASPDDLEADGLRDLWGETPGGEEEEEEDMFCSSNTEPTSDLTGSQCGGGGGGGGGGPQSSAATDASTLTPDELTPQSEHPGSAPTSDEGYYDSVTPGPEDARATLDRMGPPTDRIPGDSYSGDALYELFAPEESLVGPHYENGSGGLGGSESCGYGLGSEGMADSAFLPEMSPLGMGSNLYEEYDAVLCDESKEFAPFSQGFSGSRPQENANLNLTTQEFFNNNNRINLDPSRGENGNIPEPDERRLQSIHGADSFGGGGAEDPDDFTRFSPTTFSDAEGPPDENRPPPPPPSSYGDPRSPGRDPADEGRTVCFSQALVDYTKHSRLLRGHTDGGGGSSLSPSVEALPTIVTFDVMDMHNEGEYDDQLREGGLEEDGGSAPYPAFQESYLQREDLARCCDYQALGSVYGQSRFGDAWTIASLPRHLGLPKGGGAAGPAPASASASERRSRSLDREGLERSAEEEYPGNATASGTVYPPADGGSSRRAYPPHDTKNVHSGSAFEAPDGGGGGPWPARASSRSAAAAATDDQSEVKALRRAPAAAARPSVRDYKSGAASHRLPAGGARDGRQCAPPRLPPGESGPPYSTFAFPDLTGSDLMTMVAASGESEGGVFYAPAF